MTIDITTYTIGTGNKERDNMNTTFYLEGLTCQACAQLAKKRIEKVSGVKEVKVNPEDGRAEIDSDREIEAREIQSALSGTDYQVIL